MSRPAASPAVRIEIEHADGTLRRAVGPDAETILRAYDDAIAFKAIHGIPYRGPVMEVVREGGSAGIGRAIDGAHAACGEFAGEADR